MQKQGKQNLDEQIKHKRQLVTNIKSGIFDLIEAKTIKLAEMDAKKNEVLAYEKEITRQQMILGGERKALADLEKGIITVEKKDGNN